ncbi:MAG: hypothetical protein WCY19_01890 [Candidatus Gastranaerophilaceae bacterium]
MSEISNQDSIIHKPMGAIPFSAMVGLGIGATYTGYNIASQISTIHSPERLAKLESKADKFIKEGKGSGEVLNKILEKNKAGKVAWEHLGKNALLWAGVGFLGSLILGLNAITTLLPQKNKGNI